MKKIKVLYDATILSAIEQKGEVRGGIFFVAYNILKKLQEDERFDITLYLESSSHLKKIKENNYLSSFPLECANYLTGDKYNNKSIKNLKFDSSKYDLYFNTALMSDLDDDKIERFYVLYDAIPLILGDFFTKEGRLEFYRIYNRVFNKNTHCFCISQSCKNDFLRFFPILDENKMKIAYISSSQNFKPLKSRNFLADISKKYAINKNDKYIFSFCSLMPRKNLLFTTGCFLEFIDKYNIEDLYFYLGGAGYKKALIESIEQKYKELYYRNKDKIKFLGYVDDKDVNIFYSNALFFVYLSLYEGFGMPVLEAMQSGCAVVASNNSSIPEVVDNCGICINPQDKKACIDAFDKLYFNPDIRNELVQKGFIQSLNFNWDKTIKIITDEIINVFEGEKINENSPCFSCGR